MSNGNVIVWPYFVGGLLGPVAGGVLGLWAPVYLADAVAFFVVFAAVSLYLRRRTGLGVARALAASATGATVAGLISFVFHAAFVR